MFTFKKYKILLSLFIFDLIFSHEMRANYNIDSLGNCVKEGAIHMITGYDHILFLIGVLFFLKTYFDIFKFITAFTIAHCITLIFATFFHITANAYLVDAIIAFSVIYKGFENLDGFRKIFSIDAPNLIIMVFIFGLIHGFGLSTKLQEMATSELSLSQILSFNVGVELGQIGALLLIFPLLSLIRGKYYDKISSLSNIGLILSGTLLLIYQLNLYVYDRNHHGHESTSLDSKENNHITYDDNYDEHNEKGHSHLEDGSNIEDKHYHKHNGKGHTH